jgi:hypothetical protein
MDARRFYILSFLLSLSVVFYVLVLRSDSSDSTSFLTSPTIDIEQVHIALGPHKYSVNIAWVLKRQASSCYLEFPDYNLYNPEVNTLEYETTKGGYYLRYIYNLTVENLVPNELYYYRISCSDSFTISRSKQFEMKGPPGDFDKVTFLSLADWSTGYYSDPADNYATRAKPNILPFVLNATRDINEYDIIVHAGDYAYDLSSDGGNMGDRYMNSIQDLVSRVPYMTATGNHESHTNFTHYRKLFRTPGPDLFYSFDLGAAHFIMMDSEAFVGRFHTDLMLKQHYEWIVKDLKANKKPWTIVVSHRPMYCNPNPKCKVCTNSCTLYSHTFTKYLEQHFLDYGVDLHISADVHLYERSKPIIKNATAQEGKDLFKNPPSPIYIVNGVAGNFDRDDSLSNVAENLMEWNVVISKALGWGKVTIHNDTHLEWQQFVVGQTQIDDPFEIENEKPRTLDHFWIVKTGYDYVKQ